MDVKAASASLTTQDNFPNYYYCNKEITTDSFITMEVGQKLEVRNLVFVYTNNKEKPLDYCKSSSGFKAKSSNSKVASIKKGVITARKQGKTKVRVTKNGKTFTIDITVKKPQYTLSSQYVGVNNYLNTLSKKFPDEKSVKGKEATLVKSVSRLSLKILQYRWMIMEAEEWMEDGDYYYESSVPELFLSGCLPSDAGRYLCLENPREYFRLAGMAQNYIIKQSKKVKDLRIKSTTVEIKPGDNPRTGWGRDYIVTINLKEPLNQKHVLKEYENYNPYTYDGSGLPSTGTWKNKEEIWYVGQLYRITASGRERQVNELVFIKGKYGSKVLKSDIRMKKAATYKLYFSEYEDSSNPRKYCVTFKLDESML